MPIGNPLGRSGGINQLLGMGGAAPGIDYDQINALLQQFGGIHAAASRPMGLFENTGLGASHPGLAGGLDNALIALSNMGPTGHTAGENISNVARGVSSIPATRNAQATASIMLPLQVAGEVARIKSAGDYTNYMKAMAGYYGGRNDATRDAAGVRADASRYNADQRYDASTYSADQRLTGTKYTADQRRAAMENKLSIMGMFGGSMEGKLLILKHGPPPDDLEGQQRWATDVLGDSQRSVNVSQGGASARQQQGFVDRDERDFFNKLYQGPGTAAIREKRIKDRTTQLLFDPQNATKDSLALRRQAQEESQQHQNRLLGLWGEYTRLAPEEQRAVGGIQKFLSNKGYDLESDSFGEQSAPVSSAPTAMGAGGLPDGYEFNQFGIPVKKAPKR